MKKVLLRILPAIYDLFWFVLLLKGAVDYAQLVRDTDPTVTRVTIMALCYLGTALVLLMITGTYKRINNNNNNNNKEEEETDAP